MYSHHLDSPPPQSQFRRPWSPDPYASSRANEPQQDSYENYYNNDYSPYGQQQEQRRQPSDLSVDALDLADYATTLRQNQYQYQPHDNYPSPPPAALPPSRGNTLSSNTSSRYPSRRPFSLPPPSHSSHSGRHSLPPTHLTHNYPYLAAEPDISSPPLHDPSHSEIDITQFPPWSRTWYNTRSPVIASPTSPHSPANYDSTPPKRSVFDPGNNVRHGYRPQPDFPLADPYNSYGGGSSYAHESSRDLLPWSNEPPEYGPSLDSALKEERIRMLEREFGPNSKRMEKEKEFVDEDGKPLVGTVDEKGRLVSQGPKKRLATRISQLVFALAAAIPSIYAALFIKPKETPPPSGTPAAYILYVLSVITFFTLFFLFVIHPCCFRRRKRAAAGPSGPLANGMMVLPVQGLGGKKGKKGKGGKKGRKGMMGGGDVQVNLIVDPHAFGHRDEDRSDEEDGDWESSIPGAFGSHADDSTRRKRRRPKRRSVFAGLAMEEQWKKARSWLKKITAVDVLGIVVWGAVFIFILLGKRCPAGGFDGWCNAYNVSSAAACLLCVSFAVSVFFDVKDLHASKVSPRTRT